MDSSNQITVLNNRIKLMNAQLSFLEERRDEDRKSINTSMESIQGDVKSIKLSIDRIVEMQQAQAEEIGKIRMELLLSQERSKHIHSDNCIQSSSVDDIYEKLDGFARWKEKLADDLVELYFFKKYPKLIYILIFVCVVLALVAIYKITKL